MQRVVVGRSITAIHAEWTVVPEDAGRNRAEQDVAVVIEHGTIVDVVRGPVQGPDVETIALPQAVLIPGFVNLHNHSINGPIFRTVIDDLAPRGGADTIVYDVLLPLGDHVDDVLSPDELRDVYRLALLEMLRSGTTTILDMPRFEHAPALVEAARDVGLRLHVAPYLFSTRPQGLDSAGMPAYLPVDSDSGLEAVLNLWEVEDDGPRGLVRIGFGPHATDTCSSELLRQVAREAEARDTFVTVHVAQSTAELRTVQQRHHCSPVELLSVAGCLGPNVVAAHCVHVTQAERDLLRESGTTVAHCPLTFARSGVTVTFEGFHGAGVNTGLGTDAYAFDYFAEMRAAGLISKLDTGNPQAVDAHTLLEAATATGAAALPGHGGGRIARGAAADLVAVDLGGVHVRPVRDPIKSLVWTAGPHDVRLVMVGGRIRLDQGQVVGLDEAEIVTAGARAVERLWTSAERRGLLAPVNGTA